MQLTIKKIFIFILILILVWFFNIIQVYASCYNSEAARASETSQCAWPSGYYNDAILHKNSSWWFCCTYNNNTSNDSWAKADWDTPYEDTAEEWWEEPKLKDKSKSKLKKKPKPVKFIKSEESDIPKVSDYMNFIESKWYE